MKGRSVSRCHVPAAKKGAIGFTEGLLASASQRAVFAAQLTHGLEPGTS